MQRISVTTIESFRRYVTEASPFDTEEKLLETIKGIFVGNPKTQFGSAYHSILEGKFKNEESLVLAGGYRFTNEQAMPAINYRNRHTDIVSEVSVQKVYRTSYGEVQLSGRVDALEGLFIRDTKTKFRTPDFQEYLNSSQWKFYCDMLEAETFIYDVFEVRGFKDDATMDEKFFPDLRIMEVKSLACHTYAGMHKELITLLDYFLGFLSAKGLWHHLKPALTYESILD